MSHSLLNVGAPASSCACVSPVSPCVAVQAAVHETFILQFVSPAAAANFVQSLDDFSNETGLGNVLSTAAGKLGHCMFAKCSSCLVRHS